MKLTVAIPEAPAPDGNGSSRPASKTCFRLIRRAAHIPKVATLSMLGPVEITVLILTPYHTHSTIEDQRSREMIDVLENRHIGIQIIVLPISSFPREDSLQ
jgi:hypothetical protein